LSKTGRLAGLLLTLAMLVFSVYVYSRTGDWVAAVFAIGSVAYGTFFLSGLRSNDS